MAQALQMLGQNPLFLDEVVRNNFSPAVLGHIFCYVSGLDKFPDLFRKDQRLYEITSQQKVVEDLKQQIDRKQAQGLAEAAGRAEQAEAFNQQISQERLLGAMEGAEEVETAV